MCINCKYRGTSIIIMSACVRIKRFLQTGVVNNESDQESDDEDNDDDPDSFEDSLDDNSQKGSPVDELRLKLSDRAKVLKDNGQPNLVPKYGNSKQKPSGHQQVVSRSEEVFHCQFPGCSKICKSFGGLTLHVKKMHSSRMVVNENKLTRRSQRFASRSTHVMKQNKQLLSSVFLSDV